MIEYLSFHPIKRNPLNGLIGFCSFHYNKDIKFTELAIHLLLKPKENIRIRVRYPERTDVSASTQKLIDEEINGYIMANYPESLK